MAKSLRSKVKRKMRAIKRQKNAPKELAKLKKVLETAAENKQMEVEMAEMITLKDSKAVVEESQKKAEAMEEDKKINPKTLRDEHGQYAEWVSKRYIKKQQKKNSRKVKGKKKKVAW